MFACPLEIRLLLTGAADPDVSLKIYTNVRIYSDWLGLGLGLDTFNNSYVFSVINTFLLGFH